MSNNKILIQNIKAYKTYLDIMVEEIKKGYLSIFAGAGLSNNSGFVDWKGLMKPIVNQLGINPNVDLTAAAQYYVNEYGRHGINTLINNEFNKSNQQQNSILDILAKIPIKSYWTTNYDSLIEDTLTQKGKVVDVKITQEQFKYHKPNVDATIYKMHGDKNHPDDVVLTKDDYETYDNTRSVFTKALSVELISHTFLFIGFSFSDPNLDRIISIVRHTFEHKSPKHHYCFMRMVQKKDYNNIVQYNHDYNYQSLRIRDMRKYGIQTILVTDFSQINSMLKYIKFKITANNIFIAGTYSNVLLRDTADAYFIENLAKKLVTNGYKIMTGFGENVGNYILLGAYSGALEKNNSININNYINIHPIISFKNDNEKKDDFSRIREMLIEQCGFFLTMFGKTEFNKNFISSNDGTKDYQLEKELENDGVYQEYRIAKQLGKMIIPLGFTEHTSKYIYNEYKDQFNYIHTDYKSTGIRKLFSCLENMSNNTDTDTDTDTGTDTDDKILRENLSFTKTTNNNINQHDIYNKIIDLIISFINEEKSFYEQKIEKDLINDMVKERIFLSFKYDVSHKEADLIRDIINSSNEYTTTEKECLKLTDKKTIYKWIDKKIYDTIATVLIYDKQLVKSEYIKYELNLSFKKKNALIIVTPDKVNNKDIANLFDNLNLKNEYSEKYSSILKIDDVHDKLVAKITEAIMLRRKQ